MSNGRTLFKGGTVVTLDPKVPNLPIGDVLVDGDRIAAVGANLEADDAQVIDAADSIVMPGLIDSHHHMWLGVMRRMMPDVDNLFAYIDVVAELTNIIGKGVATIVVSIWEGELDRAKMDAALADVDAGEAIVAAELAPD